MLLTVVMLMQEEWKVFFVVLVLFSGGGINKENYNYLILLFQCLARNRTQERRLPN